HSGGVAVRLAPPPATDLRTTKRGGVAYPEWDAHRRQYRADWCTVIERDAELRTGATASSPHSDSMRRALARLGVGLTPVRRRAQGDDIDIDAAIENRVLTLVGQPTNDEPYVESLRRRRDLSALVLLDVSGSAKEPGGGGRTVHDHQVATAAALTEA